MRASVQKAQHKESKQRREACQRGSEPGGARGQPLFHGVSQFRAWGLRREARVVMEADHTWEVEPVTKHLRPVKRGFCPDVDRRE